MTRSALAFISQRLNKRPTHEVEAEFERFRKDL